jgi:hypothetical protein
VKLAPLIGIEVVAFLLTIGETYLFFMAVVPLGQVPHNLPEYTMITLLKVGLSFGLGILWLVVMASLTRFYVRSKLKARTPIPSS